MPGPKDLQQDQIWIDLANDVSDSEPRPLPGVIWSHAHAAPQELQPAAPPDPPQPALPLRRWRRGPNGWEPVPSEPPPQEASVPEAPPPPQPDPPQPDPPQPVPSQPVPSRPAPPRPAAAAPAPARRPGRGWLLAAACSAIGLCSTSDLDAPPAARLVPAAPTLSPPPVLARPAPRPVPMPAPAPPAPSPAPVPVAPEPPPDPVPQPEVAFHDQLMQARQVAADNHPKEALRLYQDLLARHRRSPAVRTGVGQCLADLEHFQEAMGHFKAALEVRPDYGPAVIGLARTYRKAGDPTQALVWYRRYLEVSPDGTHAEQSRAMIARIVAQQEGLR